MSNNGNMDRIYLVAVLSFFCITFLFFVMKIGFDIAGSVGQFFVLLSATLIIMLMFGTTAYVFYKLKFNK